ncbi:MAG: DUF4344 domain-containing metallopeptidase [Gammaproteobacteria bacterium]
MRLLSSILVAVLVFQRIALAPEAPSPPPADSQAAIRFMLANTMWTLVHEMAHALIAELDVPLLGKEEDAADRIATVALLHGSADHDIPNRIEETEFIVAAAEAWRVEWELERLQQSTAPYWDSHSLDIQRFYNIVCLLYGSDPEKYADIATTLELPAQRALECVDYEHQQARNAVTRLIQDHSRMPPGATRRGTVRVVYEQPQTPRRARIVSVLTESGLAELVAEQTERLVVLPHDITITFGSCFGDETAFWRDDRKEIIFSYDLMERFLYLYRAKTCLQDDTLTDDELGLCLERYHH